ncbi:hypothetical protein D3C86_2148070 [compost metagenome]
MFAKLYWWKSACARRYSTHAPLVAMFLIPSSSVAMAAVILSLVGVVMVEPSSQKAEKARAEHLARQGL